uniref:PAN domain protein n=1 Tax=Haemonchus contortus TaxID=6289 RepID=A0A7I4YZM6_HAECO
MCRNGTGAVFLSQSSVNRNFEIGSGCFEHCSTSNCTGVLLYDDSCVSLNSDDVYGLIDENLYLRKACVPGVISGSVVEIYREKFLDSTSEMLVDAADEYHCLSLCYKEKTIACESIIFFADSGDCLLNTENSSNASILNNEDEFRVTYMERKQWKKREQCSYSFHQVPWDQILIRGDSQLVNVSGGSDQCLSMCKSCDFVIYNEMLSECFLVNNDEHGQQFDFLDDHYQVFESICKRPTVENCSSKNALYISYYGYNSIIRNACLQKCLANPTCSHIYWEDGQCVMSAEPIYTSTKVIEKMCLTRDELDIAVLFEETEGCPARQDYGIAFGPVGFKDCMQLCLTHPTSSCEAITFYWDGRCRLLDGRTPTEPTTKADSTCQHFKLNVITFPHEKRPNQKKVKSKSKQLGKRIGKAFAAHKKDQIKIRSEPFIPSAIELEVQTVCNYDGIIIKVFSPVPITGELFARNAHENCSEVINGTEAQLKMSFSSENCALSQKDFVYENVIVVKQNNLSDVPLITEFDKLYRISCDYSNQTTKMSATSVLHVKDTDGLSLHPSGRIPYKPVKMQLRSRRNFKKSEVETVILGDDVDLLIEDESHSGRNYTVYSCVARDWDECINITFIEDGCPTLAAREYMMRGDIRREPGGFLIPLRAFRFKDSDSVRISCQLEYCDRCELKDCAKQTRRRRYLPSTGSSVNSFRNGTEVEVSLLVKSKTSPTESYCITRAGFISFSFISFITLLVQVLLLLKIVQKRRKQSLQKSID